MQQTSLLKKARRFTPMHLLLTQTQGERVPGPVLDSSSAAGDCNHPGWDAAWHGIHERFHW